MVGRYRLPPDAWRQATLVLLRYPETKVLYNQLVEEVQTRTDEQKGNSHKPVHSDPTATAAIRLSDDARFQRVKREVAAVDSALTGLDGAEREVIRRRFWNHKRGSRKICAYRYMIDIGYSERQMHRIVRRVVKAVALQLGEM